MSFVLNATFLNFMKKSIPMFAFLRSTAPGMVETIYLGKGISLPCYLKIQ